MHGGRPLSRCRFDGRVPAESIVADTRGALRTMGLGPSRARRVLGAGRIDGRRARRTRRAEGRGRGAPDRRRSARRPPIHPPLPRPARPGRAGPPHHRAHRGVRDHGEGSPDLRGRHPQGDPARARRLSSQHRGARRSGERDHARWGGGRAVRARGALLLRRGPRDRPRPLPSRRHRVVTEGGGAGRGQRRWPCPVSPGPRP